MCVPPRLAGQQWGVYVLKGHRGQEHSTSTTMLPGACGPCRGFGMKKPPDRRGVWGCVPSCVMWLQTTAFVPHKICHHHIAKNLEMEFSNLMSFQKEQAVDSIWSNPNNNALSPRCF